MRVTEISSPPADERPGEVWLESELQHPAESRAPLANGPLVALGPDASSATRVLIAKTARMISGFSGDFS